MVDIYTWTVLIAGICFVSFGLFAYLNNRRRPSNKLYGIFSASFAIWCFSWFFTLIFKDNYSQALFFARLLNLGATIIPVIFLHWVISLVGTNTVRKQYLILAYVITATLGLFSFSPLYIQGLISIYSYPVWPSAGPLYIFPILLCYGLFVGYAVWLLARGIIKSQGETKYQFAYILLGSILGFGGGMTNFPLMFNVTTIPFGEYFVFIGMLGVIACAFVFTYAAVSYKLMNMKLLSTEVFIFALWIFILFRTLLSDNSSDRLSSAGLLIMTIIIGIFLARSVVREVEQKDRIEKLAGDLSEANEKLKELDKKKTEFVSLASHQLRSPLTAIKGYSSMILEGDFGKLEDKTRDAVQRIFESSQKLVLVIEDFLNITRIELGRMKYAVTEVDIGQLVQNVIAEIKPNVEKRGLELGYEALPADYKVWADMGKISEVYSNLIDNAIKYTEKGFVKVKLSRIKNEKEGRDYVRFQISDSGVGIGPETLPHLFEKFSRAEDASKTNIIGTGLGLYVARQIVEAHGGKIWAESTGKGQGSTFYVDLTIEGGKNLMAIMQQEQMAKQQDQSNPVVNNPVLTASRE